ncbi:hypothetical protein ACVRY7_09270, partial [Streptococcus ictaluri]
LLREYVPKGVSLNPLTSEELDNYITAINERPRRLLQYQSSKFQMLSYPEQLNIWNSSYL